MSLLAQRRDVIASTVTPSGPGVSGNTLWLKADALSLSDGDPVSTWTDSSGVGPAPTASSTARPTYKTNILDGKPVVRFNGTVNVMGFASNPNVGASAGTAFSVVKITADPPTGTKTSAVLQQWGNDNVAHFPFTDGNVYDEWGSTVRKNTGNPTPSLASWRIYVQQTASGLWRSYIDGGSTHYTTATNTVIWSSSPKLGGITGSWFLDGDVAEVLVYNSQLSSANMNIVGTYLDTKYPSLTWTTI